MELSDFIWNAVEGIMDSWGDHYENIQEVLVYSEDSEIKLIKELSTQELLLKEKIYRAIKETQETVNLKLINELSHYTIGDITYIILKSKSISGQPDFQLDIMLSEK